MLNAWCRLKPRLLSHRRKKPTKCCVSRPRLKNECGRGFLKGHLQKYSKKHFKEGGFKDDFHYGNFDHAGSEYNGLTEKQVDFLCSRFYHKHKCLFLCYLSVLSSTSQKSRKSAFPLARPSGSGLPLVHETVQRIPARAGKEVTFLLASVTAGAVNFSQSRALVTRVRLTFSVSVLISLLR